ncbi:MAG: DUF2723 domain-containing protein [Candidatus Aminicenantes bacterium]|nr:DUF2723 domain-containing protein [Candidatus Aminicenantes bacterium]
MNETISFLTTLIFGFTRSLWKESILAEIYTFHLFFVAVVLYYFLKWSESKKTAIFILPHLFMPFRSATI